MVNFFFVMLIDDDGGAWSENSRSQLRRPVVGQLILTGSEEGFSGSTGSRVGRGKGRWGRGGKPGTITPLPQTTRGPLQWMELEALPQHTHYCVGTHCTALATERCLKWSLQRRMTW